MKFKATDPIIKQSRVDKGFKVEFEVDQSEYDILKELPKMQDKLLTITVEEI